MATSGHSSPEAFRRYAKQTDAQRMNAARKRRAWIAPDGPNAEVEAAAAAEAAQGTKYPSQRTAPGDA